MSRHETPTERRLHAQVAANTRWAREDGREGTAPARAAFLDGFAKAVDPDGMLAPQERARRAENAKQAFFARLALKSVQARRRKRESACS